MTALRHWREHLPPGTDAGALDLLASGSLPAAWAQRWRAHPDRVTVETDTESLTGDELARRSAAVAGRLAAAGLRSGDRVVVSAPTSAHLVVAHCALLRMGAVVVPVNPGYTDRELDVVVTDAAPAMALVDDQARAARLRAAYRSVLVAGTEVALPDGPAPALDAAAPGDPALLPYTSGTTGRPKGALLTHGNLLASAEALRLAWRWTDDDRLLLALPLFHMHGLGVGLHGALLAGSTVVLQPTFDVERVLARAADVTMFFGVPTMYARLAEATGADRLRGLRLCVSGSAPLPPALHAKLRARCGQVVLERYGMTETVMLVSNPYDGDRRAGTVGIPLPGVDVRIADDGEILVRGPNVFGGYWRRDDATQESFRDGWFRTGDLGEVDDAGYLRIAGRAKELVISGGFNVYPREVEDVLREHPAVRDAAVTGTPDPEWGEVVTAWVELDGPVDVDALKQWAAQRLAGYKRPRIVHRVDALPRNSMGKVERYRLAAPGQETPAARA